MKNVFSERPDVFEAGEFALYYRSDGYVLFECKRPGGTISFPLSLVGLYDLRNLFKEAQPAFEALASERYAVS